MNVLRKGRKSKLNIASNKVFIIVLLFVMSTFAWFTYIKTLDIDLNLRINSWNVKYYKGDGDDKTEISVRPYTDSYDSLYPGMLSQVKKITVENNGEVYIKITSEFLSLKILGQDYEIVENASDATTDYYVIKGEITESGDYKEQKFITLTDKIPFELSVITPKQIKNSNSDLITITLKWDGEQQWLNEGDEGYSEGVNLPFTHEGEKDELDTQWGHDISSYIAEHGSTDLISIGMNINAYQDVTDDVIVNKSANIIP